MFGIFQKPNRQTIFPINQEEERTLMVIRGDALARNLLGKIIQQIEALPLKIVAMKTVQFDTLLVEKFYPEHKTDDFFPTLKSYLTYGYHVALVLQGINAVQETCKLKINILRKKFAINRTLSTIHSSDSVESAKRELSFLFKPEEIFKDKPNPEAYKKIAAGKTVSYDKSVELVARKAQVREATLLNSDAIIDLIMEYQADRVPSLS